MAALSHRTTSHRQLSRSLGYRREGRVELFPGVLRTLSFVISFFLLVVSFLFFYHLYFRERTKLLKSHFYHTYSKIYSDD